jgi:tRNA dimethylallyltransferase
MSELKPLIIILGPTASGKTGLALELAKQFDGELVNADSRQIYKGMDIATNKSYPGMSKTVADNETVYTIDGIPLHLLDLITPDQKFTLADYKSLALTKIYSIQPRGKLPILVGGTGLYISALADNLDIPSAPPDKSLREELERLSAEELYVELEKSDPLAARSIDPHNKRKIIRALEVIQTTGISFSSQQQKGAPLFNILQIGISTEREELYAKIDQRVDEMMANGLIEETKGLLEKFTPELPAMSGIGYQEIGAYLADNLPLEEAVQRIKFRTHQYARRQLTWFKRDTQIRWIKKYTEAVKLVEDFLK